MLKMPPICAFKWQNVRAEQKESENMLHIGQLKGRKSSPCAANYKMSKHAIIFLQLFSVRML